MWLMVLNRTTAGRISATAQAVRLARGSVHPETTARALIAALDVIEAEIEVDGDLRLQVARDVARLLVSGILGRMGA